MKTSLTKLSSSIFFFSLSFHVWAAPVAQVVALKGTAFVISAEGKTQQLKVNEHIEAKSEVMVEEGASLALNDYYDSTYHLVGGSHLSFYNKAVQLKKGKSWIQSSTHKHRLSLSTANGQVTFGKSEFITFFDQATSKTQVLVVSGEVEVSNILNKDMKEVVAAGTFTLLDPEVENGVPRKPTKIGLNSLHAALAEFKQTPDKVTTPMRSIASVEPEVEQASVEKSAPQSSRGQIIFITSNRMPASVRPGIAHNYFKKVTTQKSSTNEVPIRVFGQSSPEVVSTISSPRKPASFHKQSKEEKVPKKVATMTENDSEFNSSLQKKMDENPNHPKALQGLIDELQSY